MRNAQRHRPRTTGRNADPHPNPATPTRLHASMADPLGSMRIRIRRMPLRAAVLTWALLCMLPAAQAGAQSALEKVIAADEIGAITATQIDGRLVGRISRAAGIPMGIEVASGTAPRSAPRTLTGLTVREALDALAATDSRYEWREMNGVVVLRTPQAWNSATDPLHLPVQPVVLHDVRARNVLSLVAAFLGAPQYRDTALNDMKRFTLEVESGTVLDLLNAAVSAHGALSWSFQTGGHDPTFPFFVYMYEGVSGTGCGVPGHAPVTPVDPARYVDAVPLSVAGSPAVLDRIVGIGSNEFPLVVIGPYPSTVGALANATRVPMGIEFLGPAQDSPTGQILATGRTLREVLDAMIAVDPRYQWREMDGVIVIRPAAAWNDPDNLLFRMVAPIRMVDVPSAEAVGRLAREVGNGDPFGDVFGGKRLSLDLPQGTVLDLANAIVRAHGELTWELQPEPAQDAARAGYRYSFMFHVLGGTGHGFGAR